MKYKQTKQKVPTCPREEIVIRFSVRGEPKRFFFFYSQKIRSNGVAYETVSTNALIYYCDWYR